MPDSAAAEALLRWRGPEPENQRGLHTFAAVFPGTYRARVVMRRLAAREEPGTELRDLAVPRTIQITSGVTTRIELRP